MNTFKEKDVVVLNDLGQLDPNQFALGDLGEIHSVNGDGTYTVCFYSMWMGSHRFAVCRPSQLAMAINQSREEVPEQLDLDLFGAMSERYTKSPKTPPTESEKLKEFFFGKKERLEFEKNRIEKGLCPKCGAELAFSHFVYVCPEHGEI